jgi:hypothetical protein
VKPLKYFMGSHLQRSGRSRSSAAHTRSRARSSVHWFPSVTGEQSMLLRASFIPPVLLPTADIPAVLYSAGCVSGAVQRTFTPLLTPCSMLDALATPRGIGVRESRRGSKYPGIAATLAMAGAYVSQLDRRRLGHVLVLPCCMRQVPT